uniref:Uncharacterized protein n=1 Tax=Anguilla anguilla TaxID=7936 RepID=A0A0E9T9R3_ANGAN
MSLSDLHTPSFHQETDKQAMGKRGSQHGDNNIPSCFNLPFSFLSNGMENSKAAQRQSLSMPAL